jgi:hypothetical protein
MAVIEFLRLSWQALFAPTPEWQAAAQQTERVEAARVHAAVPEERGS